jgi:PAS domain S-box-containing protein
MNDSVETTEELILQNRLLMQEVKRRIDQLGAINTVAAAISQSLDLDRVLETALRAVLEVVGAEAGGISLIDEESKEVVLRAQRGWIHDFVTAPMRIPWGQGMSGQVITNNDMIVHNNLDGTEEYAVPSFKEEHFRSIAMAPMRARGKIIGILSIMSHTPNQFNEEVLNVLRAVADTVGVAIDNARLYENTVEQEKRLNAVLQSTADGIIATDFNSRISVFNHAAENMLGVPANRLIGMRLREAPIQPRLRDSLLLALSSGDERNKSFQVSLENDRVISALVSPIYLDSQVTQTHNTDGWVIVLQDVTHLREAEIARAQFIQSAAHDMRNPLSVTQSSLTMLRDIVEGQENDVYQVIDIALNGVDRLQALIDDLLHLEHIESGYGFNLSEVDLGELLYEVSAQIQPLMDRRSITFNADIQQNIPKVKLDRRWISRALHNYLENATKYTQEGGTVTLRAFANDEGILHLEVVDNGPGVPMQAQAHLFERFYRVKGTEGIRGTGLGLAIVKSVADKHGGKVYISSLEGQGSTFGMTVPIIRANSA